MITQLVFPLPGNEDFAKRLADRLHAELGELEFRSFPDGESYVRLRSDPAGRDVIFVCTLNLPDPKFLPLTFAAATARQLGAARIGLIAPYLAYMRQDKRFHPGEAISSEIFAEHLSTILDWLITVDPHLHRHKNLGEIYRIPTDVVHSAPLIADWTATNVQAPFIIGPDIESEQWVSEVAAGAGAPYRVLRKERHGDRDVNIVIPDLHEFQGRTPVLVDDIVSSGRTMIETARHLRAQHMPAPTCIAVHALMSPEAYETLRQVTKVIVSTNSVSHPTNQIDVSTIISKSGLACPRKF